MRIGIRAGLGAVVVSLLAACAQVPEPVRVMRPRPQAAPDAAAIDAEAAAIQAAKHQQLPDWLAQGRSDGLDEAEVRSRNDSDHALVLLFSGPTSQRLRLEPGASGSVRLVPGAYLLTAQAADANARILPFAAQRQIDSAIYNSSWTIDRRRVALKGKGLPLTEAARQARDWVARVHADPIARESFSDGAQVIEEFMASLAAGGQAQLVVGAQHSRSQRCEMLLVHADQVFPFDVDPPGDAKALCAGAELEQFFNRASSKLSRGEALGRLADLRVPATLQGQTAYTVGATLHLNKLPKERLVLRVSLVSLNGTLTQHSAPLKLKLGENKLSLSFPAPLRDGGAGYLLQPGQRQGPLILVTDLCTDASLRRAELLANSLARQVALQRD